MTTSDRLRCWRVLSRFALGCGCGGDYLARYVGRETDDERRLPGLHRHEVAQGFQPERVECYGASEQDVIERASRLMGQAPERIWRSTAVEGWHGPPACWAQWA